MRGIAATAVVVHHALLAIPLFYAALGLTVGWSNPWVALLTYTPLHLLWAGHEAVVFFFVLSGFVLTLPFASRQSTGYARFVLRRVFRIYLPYAAAIMVSAALLTYYAPWHGDPALSSWFNKMWAQPASKGALTRMLFMWGAPTHNFDTSTWSLIFEMRVSLVFPLLAIIATRTRWIVGVVVALLMVAVGAVIRPLPLFDLGRTVYWAGFFLAGATVAANRRVAIQAVRAVSAGWRIAGISVAVIMYMWRWWIAAYVPPSGPFGMAVRSTVLNDVTIGVGALVMMVVALAFPAVDKALRRPILIWLGKVSYSLYLIHPVVLLALVYGLKGVTPIWVPLLLTPPTAMLIASWFYRLVERPCMQAGRALTARPRGNVAVPSQG